MNPIKLNPCKFCGSSPRLSGRKVVCKCSFIKGLTEKYARQSKRQ